MKPAIFPSFLELEDSSRTSHRLRNFSLLVFLAVLIGPTFVEISSSTVKWLLMSVGLGLGLMALSKEGPPQLPGNGAGLWIAQWMTSKPAWAMLIFLALITHAAVDAVTSTYSWLAGVQEMVRWAFAAGFFWIGLLVVTGPATHGDERAVDEMQLLSSRLGVASVCVSVLGLAQFYLGFDAFPQSRDPAATFANRNLAAEVVAMLSVPVVFAYVQAPSLRVSSVCAMGLLINALFLLATASRNAMFALVAALVIVGVSPLLTFSTPLSTWRRVQRLAILAAMFLASVLLLSGVKSSSPTFYSMAVHEPLMVKFSLMTADNQPDLSTTHRVEMLDAAKQMIADAVIWGQGAGSFPYVSPLFAKSSEGMALDATVHNEFVQLAAEYGLLGVFFAVSIPALLIWIATLVRRDQVQLTPSQSIAIVSVFTGLALAAGGFSWHVPVGLGLFFFYLGVVFQVVLRSTLAQARPVPMVRPPPVLGEFVLCVCVGVGSIMSLVEWRMNTSVQIAAQLTTYLSGFTDSFKKYRDEASASMSDALSYGFFPLLNPQNFVLGMDAMPVIKDHELTVAMNQMYLDHHPYAARAMANFAIYLEENKNPELAKVWIERSAKVRPGNFGLTVYAIRKAQLERKPDLAAELIVKALEGDTADPQVYEACKQVNLALKVPFLERKCLEHSVQWNPLSAAQDALTLASQCEKSDRDCRNLWHGRALATAGNAERKLVWERVQTRTGAGQ